MELGLLNKLRYQKGRWPHVASVGLDFGVLADDCEMAGGSAKSIPRLASWGYVPF